MSQRTVRPLVWSSAGLAGVLVATGLLLSLLAYTASAGRVHLAPHQFFNPLVTLTFCIVGALVASRQPRNPIGWLLSGTGFLSSLSLLALGYWMYSRAVTINDSLPGVELARWLESWVWLPQTAIPLTFILLLFPDGQLVSARWRPIAWLAGLGLAGVVLAFALDPGLAEPGGSNPVGLTLVASAAVILKSGGWLLLGVGFIGSLASLVVRFRRSGATERDQLKWIAYALSVVWIVGGVIDAVLSALGQGQLMLEGEIVGTDLTVMSIIVAIGIAIVRNRLYDIDFLINRTLVYGAMTASVVGLYVLAVVFVSRLLHVNGGLVVPLIATGLVAVSMQPLREQLQRGVNRLMYGERDDPYAVLAQLGRRLEAALAPHEVPATIVETIKGALKLSYTAVALRQGNAIKIVASSGAQVDDPLILPLVYQHETIGQMLLGPRAPREAFSPADRRLLDDLARQAGIAVHAVHLTAELQRSRERLVTAREEERRRLRRDLHDGLGPALAAQTLRLEEARDLVDSDPGRSVILLTDLIAESQTALADIRRLVYGLRPPALDELGLVRAIHEQAAQYKHEGISITIDAPERLPSLPAAVEVAAYRIVQEALTNILHHAQAHNCSIQVTFNRGLQLVIADDGVGLPPVYVPGVGLISMRERAEELGGNCTIEKAQGKGTRVVAHLPLP